MAVIGTIGDVVFEVSSQMARTFDELVHTAAGRWEIHEVVKGKPKAEFIGPGQNEITFVMQLKSSLGVDPRAEFEKIGTMVIQGKHFPFLLGLKVIGNGEWYIESNQSTFEHVNGKGVVHSIECELILKEYF